MRTLCVRRHAAAEGGLKNVARLGLAQDDQGAARPAPVNRTTSLRNQPDTQKLRAKAYQSPTDLYIHAFQFHRRSYAGLSAWSLKHRLKDKDTSPSK